MSTSDGSSRDNEDRIAINNADVLGYLGIGGSDSHIVSHIGRCGTEFSNNIKEMGDLVSALQAEEFKAINFKH